MEHETSYELSASQREVYRRFADLSLPRHTSYPVVPVWKASYGPKDFRSDLVRASGAGEPLSLYVHIPYCERLCYYCACTKEIIPAANRQARDPEPPFLEGLEREVTRVASVGPWGEVQALHWGGGSPTFLTARSLERLHSVMLRYFRFSPQAELAVEIDPRITTWEQLKTLRSLGFNRVSLGIQDFSPVVQKAVNRVQPYDVVARVVEECRSLGFSSINFDLIYGLPFQTRESMADTLDKTLTLSPDRIAFYRLAVIPEIFRWQKTFAATDLPSGDFSLDLNLLAIRRFLGAGYEFIGLDHFAKPGEGLSRALTEGTVQRNFQGMTTHRQLGILGFGPSAITQLDHAFAQNRKTTEEWLTALAGDLPVARGLTLSADDRLRRDLLQQLYGVGAVDKRELETGHSIRFDEYFSDELRRLGELSADGLVVLEPERIRLTKPLGRLLARVVASVFDRYLPPDAFRNGLPAHLASKVG